MTPAAWCATATEILVQAGTFLSTPEEVADLVVGVEDGAPIMLRDVADVHEGPDQPEQYVSYGTGPAGAARRGSPLSCGHHLGIEKTR